MFKFSRKLLVVIVFLLAAPCAAQQDVVQRIAQGRAALKAGQSEQAGLIFERILMAQPWRLGVWLDYALSLQQQGDDESARAIYRSLLRQNPPAYLAPWLKQQIAVVPGWQYNGALTLLAGRDSNLNHAQTASSMALTLPSGISVVLPLSAAARASAGISQFLRLDWQAMHPAASGGRWQVQATLNSRVAPGNSGQNYLQSGLALSRDWGGRSAYQVVMAVQNLHYGGADIQRLLRAGLYRHWQAGCDMTNGVEWERLVYPVANELDGQYLGLSAELGCHQDWQLMMRGGINYAANRRPGGNRQKIELRGQLAGRLAGGSWLAVAGVTHIRDKRGYSPLLENNAARAINYAQFRLAYQYPLGVGLQALANAALFRQYSNLSLFTLSGTAAWLGLRWQF